LCRVTSLLAALAVTSSAGIGGCGDDPFIIRWQSAPDTVLLYSLARPELNLPSAFSFAARVAVRVEDPTATGRWDMAVDTEDGRLVLLPPGALGVASAARITVLAGVDFADVREAPADTSVWVANTSVVAEIGTVYVVRTSQSPGSFGNSCVYYAKLEPVEMDPEAGTLSFLFDSNPVCNDPRLVPPD
jgi:hypothetical protein